MVRDELVPWLRQHFSVRPHGAALTLRFVGLGQSQIDQTLHDRVPLPGDVVITSLFEGSRVDFTFHLPGHADADDARLRELAAATRRHLGDYCYAEDGASLEQVVLRRFATRGRTLALAEVATGGSLAAALNGTPDAGSVIRGAFAAPSEQRLATLVRADGWRAADPPEARARALATAVAAHAGADDAVVLGDSWPESGSLRLAVALQLGKTTPARTLSIRNLGTEGRASVTTQVLDFLRRQDATP